MEKQWNRHRFSSGALALDLVNTVVRRSDAARAFDRLTNPADADRFADAAEMFRADELGKGFLFAPASGAEFLKLMDLRERIYASFAPSSEPAAARLSALANLLGASGRALADVGSNSLLSQSVLSWLRINSAEKRAKLRACPNCDWLFLDRSRNGSRIWCDMAVCGNRQKARLNYHRKRQQAGQGETAA